MHAYVLCTLHTMWHVALRLNAAALCYIPPALSHEQLALHSAKLLPDYADATSMNDWFHSSCRLLHVHQTPGTPVALLHGQHAPDPHFASYMAIWPLVLQEVHPSPGGGQGRALERVMLPFSGLASWFVVCAGSLMCLSILGINVKPLLTVGGVGTVVVGLSAQSVLANLVCGISLVSGMHTVMCCVVHSICGKQIMLNNALWELYSLA